MKQLAGLFTGVALSVAVLCPAFAAERLPALTGYTIHPDGPLPPAIAEGHYRVIHDAPLPALTKADLVFGPEKAQRLRAGIAALSPEMRAQLIEILTR